MKENLADYGLSDRWLSLFANVVDERSLRNPSLGRAIRQDRGFALVVTEDGASPVTVPSNTQPVLVGDWVVLDDGNLVTTLERSNILSRRSSREDREQGIAANVDRVFVVCGADRPLNVRRIERATAQAWQAHATPAVVVTKADLLDDEVPLTELRAAVPFADVIAVSAQDLVGIDQLENLMNSVTSVMIGESGAGKSTLVNALLHESISETQPVRKGDSKGRHTTTRRELHVLPGGGCLIDTPGIRALGMWADDDAIGDTFPDIAELADGCRFTDCSHESEPGCLVLAAVADGSLSQERLDSYQSLLREVEALDLSRNSSERRRRERKFGRLVDEALRMKGRR